MVYTYLNECMSSNKFLEINIESLKFDQKVLLNRANFTFNYPGFYLLTGENGIGKSTLLNIIAGRFNNFIGTLKYQNQLINDDNRNDFFEKEVTYLTQDSLIFDDVSTLDNILIPYYEKNKTLALDILDKLGLKELAFQDASSLSYGEKQRLAFARALYKPKPIILLDEIDSSLDINSSFIVQKLIAELAKDHLIVFICHKSLNDNLLCSSEVLEISNQRINIVKPQEFVNLTQNPQRLEKKSIFNECLSEFNRQRSLHIFLTLSLFLLSSLSIVSGNVAYSLSGSNIKQITFDNYLNSSPALLLKKDKIENVALQEFTQFDYFGKTQSVDSNLEFSSVGSLICGLFCIDENTNFESYGISLLNENGINIGRYPSISSEILISSYCFDNIVSFLVSNNNYSLEEAKQHVFSDYNAFDEKQIVGVYQGADSALFSKRIKSFDSNSISYIARSSYGYKIETAFSINDANTNNMKMVVATPQNIGKIDINMVNDEIFAYQRYSIVNVDNDGKYALSIIEINNTFFLLLIISISFMSIIGIALIFGFYSRNKRAYILFRFAGMTRSSTTRAPSILLIGEITLSFLIGLVCGSALTILVNALISSSLLASYATYVTLSAFPYIFLLFSYLGLTTLVLFVIYKMLSPKDMSKKIFEAKIK